MRGIGSTRNVTLLLVGALVAASVALARPAPAVDEPEYQWGSWSPMVGGLWGYDAGELVYQDYIYDDAGPAGRTRAGGQSKQHGLTTPKGTYRYPTDPARYGANAADLSRLRLAVDGDLLRVAVELNTLLAPDTTVAAIALATPGDVQRKPWPHGAGLATPGRTVVTMWGTGGTITDHDTGETMPLSSVGGAVAVSVEDNRIEAAIPLAVLPEGTAFDVRVGTGLWDPIAGTWMPVPATRSATVPGGGHDGTPLPALPRVWNVGFRDDEIPGGAQASQRWFDDNQADALAAGDIDRYSALVDLDLLRAGTTQHPSIPRGQLVEAIYRASFALGEGVSEAGVTGRGSSSHQGDRASFFLGREQPYALYLPTTIQEPAPAFVTLHGGSGNHTGGANSDGLWSMVAEPAGMVLVSPLCRGPNCQYTDEAELDVLEALEDARTRVGIHPDRIAIGGVSMGGYGTYRLATRHPDLFSAAVAIASRVGKVDDANGYPPEFLANLRSLPLLQLHGAADELEPWVQSAYPVHERMEALGYEHAFRTYPSAEHLTISLRDGWGRVAEWLDGRVRQATPRHVTYRHVAEWDAAHISPKLVSDRAYWLSGIVQREQGDTVAERLAAYADIDAIAGTLPGHDDTTTPYEDVGTDNVGPWVELGRNPSTADAPLSPTLDLRLTNTARLVVDTGAIAASGTVLCATVVTDGVTSLRFEDAVAGPASEDCAGAMSGSPDDGSLVVDLPAAGEHRIALQVS